MTYLIAELGSVPDGSIGNALCLIDACAAAGVDAVKLQDHLGERIKGDPPWFKPGHETREQYLKRTQFSDIEWALIRARCTERGVDLVVSPFSVEAVRRLEMVPVDAYKVASGQVTNIPMLEAIGATGRPVYVSSGMTTEDELSVACDALNGNVTVFHCQSEYPCPPERVGLNVLAGWIAVWRNHSFRRPAFGLSDHTLGMAASLAAIALGATVIERHVCWDRRGYGSDAKNSLTVDELAHLVREIRDLDKMLANPVDKDALVSTPAMAEMRKAFLE